MSIRAGMSWLVERLRGLVNDADASLWTAERLQDALDEHETPLDFVPLRYAADHVGGGVRYHRATFGGWANFEGAESGTIYWRVTDSAGAEVGTTAYTPDYRRGEVRFAADTGGSALYLTGRSYDLYAAAADLWRERAAQTADWYRFATDGQTLERQQAHAQALRMADEMAKRAGGNRPGQRGDVRTASWQRADLARW